MSLFRNVLPRFNPLPPCPSPSGKLRESGAIALVAFLLFVAPAHAQLFGNSRSFGTNSQFGNGSPFGNSPFGAGARGGGSQFGALNNAAQANQQSGTLRGSERFLRQNRRRGDFVGSDRFDRRTFVGSQQGQTAGQAIPSTLGVRQGQDRTAQINQPLPRPSKKQAYYPRLQFDANSFDSATNINAGSFQSGTQLKRELENPDYFAPSNRFQLRMEGRTAILRGVVADRRQRELAELLVSFEPGVSVVRNELVVANQIVPPSASSELPPPEPSPSVWPEVSTASAPK